MELINKLMGKNEKEVRLQNEINGLRVRKESVISVIQNEIGQLQREKDGLLLEAGTRGYANWKQKVDVAENLEEIWGKVEEIEKVIEEKNEKQASMEARYNEEISLLERDLYPPMSVGKEKQCSKCGAKVSEGDVFCEKCGNPL